MAVYTTFFLCEPAELLEGFPGWQMPLEQPVRREIRNPFTGEFMVIESREPQWPDDDVEIPALNYHAITIEGSYEDYLESRLPPFVRQRPHWAAKGLTLVELNPLIEIIGVNGEMGPALFSPPSSGNDVEGFPADFLTKLPTLDAPTVAERWAAALSTPGHTHSASGRKVSDGWSTNDALVVLNPLMALSVKRTGAQEMYLLTEV
jgi:hypothetical protein